MSFNSVDFLIFFPIVVLGYYIVPKKIKNAWLLIASYYFYMCWNAKYAVLILTSTVATYACGVVLGKIKQNVSDEAKRKRLMNLAVAASFVVNLGILGYFKYMNFFMGLISDIFGYIHVNMTMPAFDILLPVGISFYTFQALGYTVDVYRDDIEAEKNFITYALFVSFFPQLVAGPIERSKNLLSQLKTIHKFDYDMAKEGFLLIMWGLFLKMVIADRTAAFVDTVYSDIDTYGGWYIIIAMLLFTVQLYCDFAGYSIIARGAAMFLGINLMDNFQYPFFRISVAEHWRGWHISLSSWFRDYLYIPLGGSRKGTVRKYINIMIVFLVSGLWHGAGLTYVVWGGLNGLYQVIGSILTPIRKKVCEVFNMDRESGAHKGLMMFGTYLLIAYSLVIFRIDTLSNAVKATKSMLMVHNPWILYNGALYECGVNRKNFMLLLMCILVFAVADLCKMKGIEIRKIIMKQHVFARILVIAFSILFIVVFGIWGPSYEVANFIYFQF